MFVARSTTRIRRARLVFLVAGLVPTVVITAWAAHLRSDIHRGQVERRWQEAVGMPLSIGRIDHPRPGVMRAHDCMIPAVDGFPAVTLPLVEVESSADEDRVRIAGLACDTGTAAVAIEIAGRWLSDDIRFRRACVVEIGRFSWAAPTAHEGEELGGALSSLRVECVLHAASRAVRIVRRGAMDDEVRIVRHPPSPASSATTYEIDATINTPIPLAVLTSAAGGRSARLVSTGSQAMAIGTLRASRREDGWQGEARGRITGIDLAAVAVAVGDRASGTASIEVSRLAWTAGRVTDALVEAVVSSGHVDRRLFDRIVLALAARPGSAAARIPPNEPVAFDAAGCIVAIGPHGVRVQPSARLPGGIATTRGEILLAPPTGPVTADRVAWLLSSPGTTFGPTAGPGAWIISILPSLPSRPAHVDGEGRF